jgi:hypothetical protein
MKRIKNIKIYFFILYIILLSCFIYILHTFEPFNVSNPETELEKNINKHLEDICGNLTTLKDVHLKNISNTLNT